MQQREIFRMEVDKSEERPGVSRQTEICPFGSRTASSFHHRIAFPSTPVTTGNLETWYYKADWLLARSLRSFSTRPLCSRMKSFYHAILFSLNYAILTISLSLSLTTFSLSLFLFINLFLHHRHSLCNLGFPWLLASMYTLRRIIRGIITVLITRGERQITMKLRRKRHKKEKHRISRAL